MPDSLPTIIGTLSFDGRPQFVAVLTDDHSHAQTITVYKSGLYDMEGDPLTEPENFDELGWVCLKWDGCSEMRMEQTHTCSAKDAWHLLRAMEWAYNLASKRLLERHFWDAVGMP